MLRAGGGLTVATHKGKQLAVAAFVAASSLKDEADRFERMLTEYMRSPSNTRPPNVLEAFYRCAQACGLLRSRVGDFDKWKAENFPSTAGADVARSPALRKDGQNR